jgi:hypothetical protein
MTPTCRYVAEGTLVIGGSRSPIFKRGLADVDRMSGDCWIKCDRRRICDWNLSNRYDPPDPLGLPVRRWIRARVSSTG